MSIGETRNRWLQKNRGKVNEKNRKWMEEYRKTNYYITKVKPNRKYKKVESPGKQEVSYRTRLKKKGIHLKRVKITGDIHLDEGYLNDKYKYTDVAREVDLDDSLFENYKNY